MRGFPASVRRRAYAAGLVLLACLAAQAASPAANSGRELLAVGDIHGDFDHFVAILQRVGIIDAQNRWSGRDFTLVQNGDLIDRGPKPREVMDLVMSLQKEAGKGGGHVVVLLGNHEMMNIMGDLRYVTPENYASFADNKSAKRQHAAYEDYAKWRKSHIELLAAIPQLFQEQSEADWVAKHPLGFVEQREAFGPDGKYGKWLRGLPAVAKVESVIFLHGGISPRVATMKLEQINREVHDEIQAFDNAKHFLVSQNLVLPFFTLEEITAVVQAELAARMRAPTSRHPAPIAEPKVPEHVQRQIMEGFLGYPNWLGVVPDGPLWFRGYDEWNEEQGAEQAQKLLQTYRVNHIVVGHTPQPDGHIRSRFGGKIFLIDTGMLSSYYPRGKASALEIVGETKFTAEYLDEKIVLLGGEMNGAHAGSSSPAAQPGVTAQPNR